MRDRKDFPIIMFKINLLCLALSVLVTESAISPGWKSQRLTPVKSSSSASLSSSSSSLADHSETAALSPEIAIPSISLVSKRIDVPSASFSDTESVPVNPLPDPVVEVGAESQADEAPGDHQASGSTNTQSESEQDMTDSITLVPVDDGDEETEDERSDADDDRRAAKAGSSRKPAQRYLSAPLSDGRTNILIPLPTDLDEKTGVVFVEDIRDGDLSKRTFRTHFFMPSHTEPISITLKPKLSTGRGSRARGARHSASSNTINNLNKLLNPSSSVTPAPSSAKVLRTISVSDRFLTTLLGSSPAARSSTTTRPTSTSTTTTATTAPQETETITDSYTTIQYLSPAPPSRSRLGSRRVPVRKLVRPPLPLPRPPPVPESPPARTTTTSTTSTTSTTTTTTEEPSTTPDYEDEEEDEFPATTTRSSQRTGSLLRVSPLTDLTTIESLRSQPDVTTTSSPPPSLNNYWPAPAPNRAFQSSRPVPRRTLLTSTTSTSATSTTSTSTTTLPTIVTKQSQGRVTGGISRSRTKPSRLTIVSVADLTPRPATVRYVQTRPTTTTQSLVSTTEVPNTVTTTRTTSTAAPPTTTARKMVKNFRSNTTTSKAPVFSEEELAELTVPGIPGVDYPVYRDIPLTAFDCRNTEYPGFYADIDTSCQVYHSCGARGRRHSFLCPNGTIFSQEYLICDWWYNVQCTESSNHYQLNKDAFSSPSTTISKERDNESSFNSNNNYSGSNGSEERVVVINVRNLSENRTMAVETRSGERDTEDLTSAASAASASSSSSSSSSST